MKIIPAYLREVFSNVKSLFMEEMNPEKLMGDVTPEGNQEETTETAQTTSEPVQAGTPKKITLISGFSAVFNGLGIGLLLGILLGLSISPVVSGVIATLSSLLAIFLGLNERYLDPLKSLRIGAFGLFAVVGILIGIYMRANDPFAPTLLDEKNEYVAIGYSDEEARAFITGNIKADTGKAKRQANVLYSSSVQIEECDKLKDAGEDWPLSEIVNVFNYAGGTWAEFAAAFVKDLPEEVASKALLTMRESFCGSASSGEIKMTNLDEIGKLGEDDSVSEIEKVLSSSASGETWKTIVQKVQKNIPEDQRKKVYLLTIKVLSREENH